ncbi:transposase [Nocardiopsis alba]|uniref:transposase n=1 Tax=Nocardiopsis alba TaxID=53437 RepID=UPI0035D9D151
MVERLVPDELWELFRRVVPKAPTNLPSGERRRHRDREVPAAIIFVATSGCTWARLPPVFGPSRPTEHRRFTEWSRARVWAKLHRLARRVVESSQRLGRRRWQVERTMAWLAGCRCLRRRYERKADHFLTFAGIACTLICCRRLTK